MKAAHNFLNCDNLGRDRFLLCGMHCNRKCKDADWSLRDRIMLSLLSLRVNVQFDFDCFSDYGVTPLSRSVF